MLASKLYECMRIEEFNDLAKKEKAINLLLGISDEYFRIDDDIGKGDISNFKVYTNSFGRVVLSPNVEMEDIHVELPYICEMLVINYNVLKDISVVVHKSKVVISKRGLERINMKIDISDIYDAFMENCVTINTIGTGIHNIKLDINSKVKSRLITNGYFMNMKAADNIIVTKDDDINIAINISDKDAEYINRHNNVPIGNFLVINSIMVQNDGFRVVRHGKHMGTYNNITNIPYKDGADDTGLRLFHKIREKINS